ncbi:hypothetical protein BJ085DRAFT_23158, partial [Dimargaris cristalligena]
MDKGFVKPGVRKFVWDHIQDNSNILATLEDAGLTISGEKSLFGTPSIKIVGFICNKDGRRPSREKINKIMAWPPPENLTQ